MTDDDSPALGLDLPDLPPAAAPYRVLARKYRPQTFAELIGQDAMVTTLANAIERGRIAHAFLLTGVRGVGKTSTARLIAKALNCVGPDGKGGPTITPCGLCEPCRAIAEGRHIDVIEIDAASNNGVDSVREMTDAVRYAAVSARYKMYIIDEVHMLSKPAFNALLKTLEEPPEHVKFILATTEVDKVPVTVLSRCQRFDLRRIPAEKLANHFRNVAEAEQVEVEDEALRMISVAAEGSARDGLSMLDQAIALGDGRVSAQQVRDMLGLADRGRVRRLLERVLTGEAAAMLADLDEAHSLGIDPTALIRGLMEELHSATRVKAGASAGVLQSAEQRESAETMADRLTWAQIHRLWQLLLKGLGDVQVAPDPQEAATMALLRLIHAAEMPDPAALIERIQAVDSVPAAPSTRAASAPQTSGTSRLPPDFSALVKLVADSGKHHLAQQLHDHVGLVRFAPPDIALKPQKPLGTDWPRDLAAALKSATGATWSVSISDQESEPSLLQQEKMAEEKARADVLSDPAVQAVIAAFPDAELETFQTKEA